MADAPATGMRLDLFLWFARLAKTRQVAQGIAAEGRMRIDGRKVDRSHAAVRVGNVLTFVCNGRVRVVRIAALPQRRGPAPEAQGCYEEIVEAAPGIAHVVDGPHPDAQIRDARVLDAQVLDARILDASGRHA